jgi:hypothetical protein
VNDFFSLFFSELLSVREFSKNYEIIYLGTTNIELLSIYSSELHSSSRRRLFLPRTSYSTHSFIFSKVMIPVNESWFEQNSLKNQQKIF